ncbi:MAG TPA: hypothetical protein VLI39_07720 [Sedimentisphaerales bacterium]|nr:hypothetical protein [Sedimentisphaerales bacterium]
MSKKMETYRIVLAKNQAAEFLLDAEARFQAENRTRKANPSAVINAGPQLSVVFLAVRSYQVAAFEIFCRRHDAVLAVRPTLFF